MLSALVVLASEKDPLAELSNISDISRLAVAIGSLKAHLQYTYMQGLRERFVAGVRPRLAKMATRSVSS